MRMKISLTYWAESPGCGRGARFGLDCAMPKQPTKPQTHSWAVYHLKGTPAKLVGIVYAGRGDRDYEGDRGLQGSGKPARPADRPAAGIDQASSTRLPNIQFSDS